MAIKKHDILYIFTMLQLFIKTGDYEAAKFMK